jgi:hypothetical protein
MKKNAQGTIEYLVIIGIVVVIGLAVVSLLTNSVNTQSTISTTQTIENKTKLLGIDEVLVSEDGNYLLQIRSNKTGRIEIINVATDTNESLYSNNNDLTLGETVVFPIYTDEECTTKTTTKNIIITYIDEYGLQQKEYFNNVIINCENYTISENAKVANNETIPEESENETVAYFSSCWDAGANPRPVCNCDDLSNIRNSPSSNYALQNDINMLVAECSTHNDSDGFESISNFAGNFDGNDKQIIGLYINKPTTDNIGLFTILTNNGDIYDVEFKDVNIVGQDYVGVVAGKDGYPVTLSNITFDGVVSGRNYVGGILGQSGGANTFTQITIDGNVNGTSSVGGIIGTHSGTAYRKITFSNMNGNVTGNGERIGGMIGYSYRYYIEDSNVSGTIINNSTSNYTGGFIGGYGGSTNTRLRFSGRVESNGSRVGGIAGQGTTTTYSVSTGYVKGEDYVGGFNGYTSGGGPRYSFSSATVIGDERVAGFVGSSRYYTFAYLHSDANVTGRSRVGGILGDDYRMSIQDSMFTGTITAVNNPSNIGGIIGVFDNGYQSHYIRRVYSDGNINSSGANSGGIFGGGTVTQIQNSFVSGNLNLTHASENEKGFIAGESESVSNVAYYSRGENPPGYCRPNSNNSGCDEVTDLEGGISFFYNYTNEPMASWDFETIWSEDNNNTALPTLQNVPTN